MIMVWLGLLALGNGILVVLTRLINARLGQFVSWSGASIWNHLVGFAVLAVFILVRPAGQLEGLMTVPVYLFLGGLIGAGYVALNNWILPKIGAAHGTILVIAGQIGIGTIIEVVRGQVTNLPLTLTGITLVLIGVWSGRAARDKNREGGTKLGPVVEPVVCRNELG